MFHNLRSANGRCRRKAKMSALSKVGMSVLSLLVVRVGGCGSDGVLMSKRELSRIDVPARLDGGRLTILASRRVSRFVNLRSFQIEGAPQRLQAALGN